MKVVKVRTRRLPAYRFYAPKDMARKTRFMSCVNMIRPGTCAAPLREDLGQWFGVRDYAQSP